MRAGRGTWTSFDGAGREIAEGPFSGSRPEGVWRMFHASGRVAAQGKMRGGIRSGTWTFYHDVDGEVPVARGRFGQDGGVVGTWRHFDRKGAVIAETWSQSAEYGLDLAMREVGRKDGIGHALVEGNVAGDFHRLDLLTVDGERFYVEAGWDARRVLDVLGRELVRGDAGVVARGGGWGPQVARAARRGEVEAVRRELIRVRWDSQGAAEATGGGEAVDATTVARMDRALAALDAVRTPTPEDIKALAMSLYPADDAGEASEGSLGSEGDGETRRVAPASLEEVIAGGMTWYVEWPHIDQRFEHVYATLPGHYAPWTAPIEDGDVARVAGIVVR